MQNIHIWMTDLESCLIWFRQECLSFDSANNNKHKIMQSALTNAICNTHYQRFCKQRVVFLRAGILFDQGMNSENAGVKGQRKNVPVRTLGRLQLVLCSCQLVVTFVNSVAWNDRRSNDPNEMENNYNNHRTCINKFSDRLIL